MPRTGSTSLRGHARTRRVQWRAGGAELKSVMSMFGHDRGTEEAEQARLHAVGSVATEVHMAWVNSCRRGGGAHAEYTARDVIGHRLRRELGEEGDEPTVAVEAAGSLLRVGHLMDRRCVRACMRARTCVGVNPLFDVSAG